MTTVHRQTKPTLTAIELDRGDTFELITRVGHPFRMQLVSTEAEIVRTTLKQLKAEESGARTDCRFRCVVAINDTEHCLEREVSTQRSFYEPWEIDGVRLWFDAVQDIFEFLTETHEAGPFRPPGRGLPDLSGASPSLVPSARTRPPDRRLLPRRGLLARSL